MITTSITTTTTTTTATTTTTTTAVTAARCHERRSASANLRTDGCTECSKHAAAEPHTKPPSGGGRHLVKILLVCTVEQLLSRGCATEDQYGNITLIAPAAWSNCILANVFNLVFVDGRVFVTSNVAYAFEAAPSQGPVFVTCLGSSIDSHINFAPIHIPDNGTGTKDLQEDEKRPGAAHSHAAAFSIVSCRL